MVEKSEISRESRNIHLTRDDFMQKSYDYVKTVKYELLKRNHVSHVDVKLEPNNAFKDVSVLQSIDRWVQAWL